MSSIRTDIGLDDISDIDTALLTLRKPTELHKVLASVPKPPRAVPKNGLPTWHKLNLDCKLFIPEKIPEGKVVYTCGKIGADIRRIGLGVDGPRPTFDLSDPNCTVVPYDYTPVHDPHLAHHFSQKRIRAIMKRLGYCTKDGLAVCTLKEFNTYRKFLFTQLINRMHIELKLLDERAKDDLTMKRVENDVQRRQLLFVKSERIREHFEQVALEHAEEWAEQKRRAKEQEQMVQERLKKLYETNEKQRQERAAKILEKENMIKQRIQAAAELELRRKITLIRKWRSNEKKMLKRMKREKEMKEKRLVDETNQKWAERVAFQNEKLQKQAMLLKLYTDDMTAAVRRRMRKSEIYAYNAELELNRRRIANLKLMHGATAKAAKLVKTMGNEFEKNKRGAKDMTPELAHRLAAEAMVGATAAQGDALMILGQARIRMDTETILPSAPLKLADEILENVITEFTRRRVHRLLRDIESRVYAKCKVEFFKSIRPPSGFKGDRKSRWSKKLAGDLAKYAERQGITPIVFGKVVHIPPDRPEEMEFKSIKDRTPTPVPSKTKLAEVTFSDKMEDLPEPVSVASFMPERKKILEMLNLGGKIIMRSVNQRVEKGMDCILGKVTIPFTRHPLEWGEAVEGLSEAVINNRIHSDCADVRRTAEFLTQRILKALYAEMKEEKQRIKMRSLSTDSDAGRPFYVPGEVKTEEPPTEKPPEEAVPPS